MKIHEIIRQKRLEKGMTQEQLANLLGVSPPAVNKWERAVSYPDITLLPPLARVLDTDLNTLLSFQEDLTPQEVGSFLNELCTCAEEEGVDAAFSMAEEKLRAFPSSPFLALNTALTLDGILSLYEKTEGFPQYRNRTESLLRWVSTSQDTQAAQTAKALLIGKHMERNEFNQAQALLEGLPEAPAFDRHQLQINLHLAQEDWQAAAQLTESRLLQRISSVQSLLSTLTEVAVREQDTLRAERITEAAKAINQTFGLWEFNAYADDFLLASLQKDPEKGLNALNGLLASLSVPWEPKQTPFWVHLNHKEDQTPMGPVLLSKFLRDMNDPDCTDYDFLRDHPDFSNLLTQYL